MAGVLTGAGALVPQASLTAGAVAARASGGTSVAGIFVTVIVVAVVVLLLGITGLLLTRDKGRRRSGRHR